VSTIGIDIIEIERIEAAIAQWGNRFLAKVYTHAELQESHVNPSSLAAKFAAKEAVMKVLGKGGRGIGWREIEILSNEEGKPEVTLYGHALKRATELNLARFSLSLSDSKQYAIAVALGE
jgi:holo-[acyl-carrier protein] synthase